MKPNWRFADVITPKTDIRARVEVTANFDGMLGKKGFEHQAFKKRTWFEIDGVGKFGLREGEYKYIDDGVY